MEKKWMLKVLNQQQNNIYKKIKGDKRIALSDISLRYLIMQGYDTIEKINDLLYFKEKDIPDIRKAKDVDKFLNRLILAYQRKECITVISDYDSDGINGAAVFMRAIRGMYGFGKVNYFVSHRIKEGYGISKKSVKRLLDEYPETTLIVTIDNGITGFEGVEYANSLGIDVIISDHHEPKEDGSLPDAVAIVDVKRHDDEYPFKELCGAGLIYRLMQELYVEGGYKRKDLHMLLPYVACATVGDVVSLTGENRFYVKEGLKWMRGKLQSSSKTNSTLQCFDSLRQVTNTQELNEETLGFLYVPILNAIGRIEGDVIPAIEFMLEDDEAKSLEMAQKLVAINEKRKRICKEEEEIVMEHLDVMKNEGFLVLADESFDEGIVGIIAGRVKEKTMKPTIVLTQSEEDADILKGSGRSVPGFNIKKALEINKELLVGFGGHELAAGLTIRKKNLAKFQEAMSKLVDDNEFYNRGQDNLVKVDIAVTEKDINLHLINTLDSELRPFGQGFPKPVIGLKGFKAQDIDGLPYKAAESEKKHLKLRGEYVSVMWFNGYQEWKKMGMPLDVKCIGHPQVNFYRGKTDLQFIVSMDNLRVDKV